MVFLGGLKWGHALFAPGLLWLSIVPWSGFCARFVLPFLWGFCCWVKSTLQVPCFAFLARRWSFFALHLMSCKVTFSECLHDLWVTFNAEERTIVVTGMMDIVVLSNSGVFELLFELFWSMLIVLQVVNGHFESQFLWLHFVKMDRHLGDASCLKLAAWRCRYFVLEMVVLFQIFGIHNRNRCNTCLLRNKEFKLLVFGGDLS